MDVTNQSVSVCPVVRAQLLLQTIPAIKARKNKRKYKVVSKKFYKAP